MFGALGYIIDVDLYKKSDNLTQHFFTPKAFFRYSPDFMKKQDTIVKLNHLNLFNIDRFEENNNFESGSSVTLGFDYEAKNDKNFKLSAGQVINQRRTIKNHLHQV